MKTEDQLKRLQELSPAKRALLLQALQKQASLSNAASRIGRRPDGPAPLSYSQQRLWFIDQMDPGNPAYNIPMVIRLDGLLDQSALEAALRDIMRRHEALRSIFRIVDGEPIQIIDEAATFALSLTDLESTSADERESAAQEIAVQEAGKPFDLSRGPLLRARLLRLAQADHILVLTMHHIASDGWSLGVMAQEIVTLYSAFASDQPSPSPLAGRAGEGSSPLPDLPIQYADFAHWQRESLQGDRLAALRGYWKNKLDGAATVLEVPPDCPRPALQGFRGKSAAFHLSRAETNALKALAQQEEATLFMALLTAWVALLHRYTGQEDLIVGSPIAGRNRRETEPLIGFFLNTLPFRARVSSGTSFRELLIQVRDTTLEAYAHQDLPVEMLIEDLKLERDTSRNALCQVMFALQNHPFPTVRLPGITFHPVDVHSGTAKCDLYLEIRESDGELEGSLDYNCDLYHPNTMAHMVEHLRTLASAAVADPDCRVAALPLLTPADRHKLLALWNDTQKAFPHERCIHQLFEEQAARTPAAIAVSCDDRDLTYDELNAKADRLARDLSTAGARPDLPIAVFMERSLELCIALLAIMKAGGACVPLDPAYPAQRLNLMLADCRAPIILTQRTLIDRLPTHDATVVLVDAEGIEADSRPSECGVGVPARESPDSSSSRFGRSERETHYPSPGRTEPERAGVGSDNAAYILYTSGSTGTPRGVVLTHRGLVNHNLAAIDLYGLTAQDSVLQMSSISFDIAVEEMFPAWLCGARVVLRPATLSIAGIEFLDWLRQENITILDLPTAYWNAWTHDLSLLGEPLPLSLRLVIVGGEQAQPSVYASWRPIAGAHTKWLNTYGPTETSVVATYFDPESSGAAGTRVRGVSGGTKSEDKRTAVPRGPHSGAEPSTDNVSVLPIGVPIANTRVYVLDGHGQLVPAGVIGELYIGGEGVSRGYLGRPALTAERFVPDPFGRQPGGRLYKTGDMVRQQPDGNLEFIGRRDHQVKIRGFRIEPTEVEAALAEHPGIASALVLVRTESVGKRLVAYVVPEAGDAADTPDLRGFLKGRLPDYMVPSAFVFLDSFPLTPNGKVDRTALPAPEADASKEYVAPRTPVEQALADVWSTVLSAQRVGIHDNFFDLGGDSLLAVRAVGLAKQRNIHISVKQMFEFQTVAELAAIEGTADVVLAEQATISGPVPLTPHALWVTEIDDTGLNYSLPPGTPPDLVANCLQILLAHHDALRMRLRWRGLRWGDPAFAQEILPPSDVPPFLHIDYSHLSETEQLDAVTAKTGELVLHTDIEIGPCLKMVLFSLGPNRPARLLVIMHHVVADGYSCSVFMEDFITLLGQLSRGSAPDWGNAAQGRGEAPRLPAKTTSYRDWAARMHEYLSTGDAIRERDFWLGLPWRKTRRLPMDTPHGEDDVSSMRGVTLGLDLETSTFLLGKAPAVYNATLMELLLTGLACGFAKSFDVPALSYHIVTHARHDIFPGIDLTRTVGNIADRHPVLLDVGAATTLEEALRLVQQQYRAIPNEGTTYTWVTAFMKPGSDDAPIIPATGQVFFNYVGPIAPDQDIYVIPFEADPPIVLREDNMRCVFPNLTPGCAYRVRLHFIERELRWFRHGFDISLNGECVLTDFDIHEAAGGYDRPVVRQFDAVADLQGEIRVGFLISQRQIAKIAAVEVLDADNRPVYRINAGGPAIGAFEADRWFSGGEAESDESGLESPSNLDEIYRTYRIARPAPLQRRWPLQIKGEVLNGCLQFYCEYSHNIYKSATVENVVRKCLDALKDLVTQAPA